MAARLGVHDDRPFMRAHPRLTKALQARARPRHARALRVGRPRASGRRPARASRTRSPGYLALSLAVVAAYYLVFILGWIRMLDAWDIHISYRVGLQAEMVSMLAKYLPGGVWTPAARALALRRYGGRHRHADGARVDPRRGCAVGDLRRDRLRRQPRVGARRRRAAAAARRLRTCLLASLLHPRIFRPLVNKLLKPFGAQRPRAAAVPAHARSCCSSTAARG